MINGFGSLYVGYLDMDDIGFQGTPVNDRAFSNAKTASVSGKTEAIGDPVLAPFVDLLTIEDAIESGGWLCGPPDLIVEQLKEMVLERLEWFARDAVPAFTRD